MPEFQPTDFDPTQTNSVYELFAPCWRMCRDFAEMHEHVLREGTYLDRFGGGTATPEPASQYHWRKQAAFAIDYCADLIDLRVGNLFRTAPVRRYDDSPWAEFIERFLASVDHTGTTMDAFMTDTLRKYYTTGVDIVVDKPLPPQGVAIQSRADEQILGLMPYLTAMTPLQRPDWACDHAGRYLWVRYDLGHQPPSDESSDKGDRQFLTLSRDSWRVYRVCSDGTACVASASMRLGITPVVRFYARQSDRPEYRGVPLSLLSRIAPVARALLNLISQGQLDIYMAIGVLAAIGVDPEKLPTEMAPMCWLGLPEGADVKHIRPAVEHIAEKREWIRMAMEAILRMGKVVGPTGELSGRATSGFQVAAERTDLDNEMAATATQLESVERDVIRLAISRMEGRLVDHREIGYSVEYNRKYVLSPAVDIVKQAREFFDSPMAGALPEMGRVFLRKVLDSVMKKDDSRYDAIVGAIENAVIPANHRVG